MRNDLRFLNASFVSIGKAQTERVAFFVQQCSGDRVAVLFHDRNEAVSCRDFCAGCHERFEKESAVAARGDACERRADFASGCVLEAMAGHAIRGHIFQRDLATGLRVAALEAFGESGERVRGRDAVFFKTIKRLGDGGCFRRAGGGSFEQLQLRARIGGLREGVRDERVRFRCIQRAEHRPRGLFARSAAIFEKSAGGFQGAGWIS